MTAIPQTALTELPLATHVSVRMEAASAPSVAACLGTAVPLEPGTFTGGEPAILRLGPDEWLVIAASDVEPALRAVLTGRRDAVVDVSDQRTTLELSGPRAREILSGGCSIDLHPRAFGPGRCAETTLARTGVIVLQHDDAPTYRLLVRRSFAAYAMSWLRDAMIELDHPV